MTEKSEDRGIVFSILSRPDPAKMMEKFPAGALLSGICAWIKKVGGRGLREETSDCREPALTRRSLRPHRPRKSLLKLCHLPTRSPIIGSLQSL